MHKVMIFIEKVPPAESPARITLFGVIPKFDEQHFIIQQYAYQTSFI